MTAPAKRTPPLSMKRLVLRWRGVNDRRTMLLDRYGRNLFEMFAVSAIKFEAHAESSDAKVTLEMTLDEFSVPCVRASLRESDLRRLASEHGFRLVPEEDASRGSTRGAKP